MLASLNLLITCVEMVREDQSWRINPIPVDDARIVFRGIICAPVFKTYNSAISEREQVRDQEPIGGVINGSII